VFIAIHLTTYRGGRFLAHGVLKYKFALVKAAESPPGAIQVLV